MVGLSPVPLFSWRREARDWAGNGGVECVVAILLRGRDRAGFDRSVEA